MQRRTFIKNAICLGCMGAIASGCKNILTNNENLKNDKFYYKSKEDLPKRIRIEACSLCQLNCPACTVRKLEKQMPKDWLGYLRFKDFKKFVDDNSFEEIGLANNGEIFLNPELDEIIKYAHKKGITLSADAGVNLNDVSQVTLENLVKYRFRHLRVSIDGATPEIYKIYRVGGDFNKVINNIKKINYFKKKYNSEYPHLIWQFILFGHNEHEIELAKQKAKELNMKIEFKRNMSKDYSPVKNKELIEKQTGLKLFEDKKKLLKDMLEKQNLIACYTLFDMPQIDWNGELLGCCRIYNGSFKVNAFKVGLLDALNSPDVIYAKNMITNLSFPAKDGIPCTNCSRYKLLKKENTELLV